MDEIIDSCWRVFGIEAHHHGYVNGKGTSSLIDGDNLALKPECERLGSPLGRLAAVSWSRRELVHANVANPFVRSGSLNLYKTRAL